MKLSEFSLIADPDEKETLLADIERFNATATDYPRDRTIHGVFQEQAARTPTAVAAMYGESSITYQELDRRSNQLARLLVNRGIEQESLVGVMLDRSLDMVIAILAVLKAGSAYLPLNTDLPLPRLKYMLDDARARSLILGKQSIRRLNEFSVHCPALEMIHCMDTDDIDVEYDTSRHSDRVAIVTPSDTTSRQIRQSDRRTVAEFSETAIPESSDAQALAYVIYTSGTTGRPKGVMVEHRAILRLVLNTNYVDLGPADRILQTGALSFDASTFEIWGALLNGGAVCFPEEDKILDPAKLGRLIEDNGITTIFLTTSLFNLLVAANPGIFQPLKTLLTGGERVSLHHFNKLRESLPSLKLLHVYGPTENTTFSTSFQATATLDNDIPIGSPIANSTAYILDESLQPTPIGTPGELCTGGDGLARGYLNDPELTSRQFIPNPVNPLERIYRSGDLARWLSDGNIEFIGRKDDQVKVRGYRIEPAEIQNCIVAHEAVREAFVLAKDLGAESNELIAYVVCDASWDPKQLKEFLKSSLPDYMIPAFFVRLDSLPLTANGKVDRRALPKPDSNDADSPIVSEAPQSETEKQLARIWEEVLGRKGVGRMDNFFDIGGHSLRVTRLVTLIQERLGVVLPLKEIFAAATLCDLAQSVLDVARFGVKEVDEAMICLNDATDGPCLFAFPPGTGDALGYTQLSRKMESYRFYGFNFIRSTTRLSDYADLVTSVSPAGPYLFLGYSSGGNLAYHVAREIEARGKHVSDILMIDSARKLEPITFQEQDIRNIADQFLNHESTQPYLTSAILREKAYQLVRSSYHAFGEAVDYHRVGANIHVLLCDDSQDSYHDATGPIVSSVSKWSEVTDGTFKTYQGVGSHNDALYEPHLSGNLVLMLDILNHAWAISRTGARSEECHEHL